MANLPVIFLMGPTAVGKTRLALYLYQHLPVDVVNVDAAQVYRSMDIGTAKPSPEELAAVPHRLIDIRDPAETYSAAEFCADATREIAAIHRAGRVPLLVGGTIFYFHSLEFGLSSLPSADAAVRTRLEAEVAEHGAEALHRRLAEVDPIAAARLHPNDRQRVQRALEVYEITGQPLSEQVSARPATVSELHLIKTALIPEDKALLNQRIDKRFRAMLGAGWIEEVEALRARGDMGPQLPSVRMVGYRQIWEYLSRNIGYNEMVEHGIAATRQLAKRQRTWLRSYPGLARYGAEGGDTAAAVLEDLKRKLGEFGVY
jgi:tRNA dimethylallyltransferase